jgi:hypothetical protein
MHFRASHRKHLDTADSVNRPMQRMSGDFLREENAGSKLARVLNEISLSEILRVMACDMDKALQS